jgi:hypothetical protein
MGWQTGNVVFSFSIEHIRSYFALGGARNGMQPSWLVLLERLQ